MWWITYLAALLCLSSCQSLLPDIPVLTSDSVDGVVKGMSPTTLTCSSSSTASALATRPIWFLGNKAISVDIDAGYESSADGKTLTISVFRRDHKGEYCCMVNHLRSNTIKLQRARIKDFDIMDFKDMSLDVIVGNVAVIPCSPPASRPNAQTVFEINGDTIDETSGRYYLLPNGNLQIYPVQLSDSGSYRCVAVNPVTAEKKPAPQVVRLNVVASTVPQTPELVALSQGGNRQISPAEGTNVVLSCVFQGYPIPRIAWQRYQSALPLNHSVKFGNLVIDRIKPEDSGTYQCLVENSTSLAPEVEVFVIDVQAKPRIGFIPYELTAFEGSSLTLDCPIRVAGTPAEEAAAQPLWYYNGIAVEPDGENVLLNQTGENDLFIKETSLMFSGFYQCVISNAVGEDSSYIDVTVKPISTSAATVPLLTTPQFADGPRLISPEIIDVRQVKAAAFLLTWTIDATATVFSYRIRIKPGSDEWTTVARDIPRQATSYEINIINPGKKYRFMVVALYDGRRTAESDPTRRIRLDADFEVDYTNAVELNTMMRLPTTREDTTHALTTQSTTTYPPTTTPEPPTTTATTSCVGICSPPTFLDFSDFVNVTRNAGTDISSLCLTEDDASYRWYKDGLELSSTRGKIEMSMRGSMMTVMNVQAEDSGWYVCEATNHYGSNFIRRYIHIEDPLYNAGPVTERTFTTPSLLPDINRQDELYPPSRPRVAVLSPTEVQIEWDPITHGIAVSFYKVQYRVVRGGSANREARWVTLDGSIRDATSYKVAQLTPGASYKFRVSAMYENNEHRQSERSSRIDMPVGAVTERPDVLPPNMAPQIIMAKQTDHDVLTLRWLYNGERADRFIVQYKRTDEFTREWSEFPVVIEIEEDLREMQVAISKLALNTEYRVRVFAENAAGRSRESNTVTRSIEESFGVESLPDKTRPDDTHLGKSNYSDSKYMNKNVSVTSLVDNDMLYIILGSALGAMVLVLIILVAICGFKQRQQRQAILAMRAINSNKFADPSKLLYTEKMNGSNGNQQFLLHSSLHNGNVPSANGTLTSVHSQSREPRMSLNINPLNELDERYADDTGSNQNVNQNVNASTDYNLMQHYPHYQTGTNSRLTPTLPLYHQSQNSLVSHPDGSQHYSHGSLPLHQRQPHNPPHQPSGTTPQFSTFLPHTSREGSPLPTKLPHPHGLRAGHRPQSPVSSLSETQQGGQRRKRRKRSAQMGSNSLNQSNAGSGREYMTNTDLSSDDGRELEEGHYSRALPPPPSLPNYTANLNQSDNE